VSAPAPARTWPGAPARSPRDSREGGFVGGIEGVLFGLLVFVAGALLVGAAWGVIDTKLATEAAAREAVRAYVKAPSEAAAAAAAQQAGADSLAGYGRAPSGARISLVAGGFERCGRVTIEVDYPVRVVSVPFVGRFGSRMMVRSRHSELVDAYRSGLPGTAACG
jgi:hypothetical protein